MKFAEWIIQYRPFTRRDNTEYRELVELYAQLYGTTQASFGCCGGYHGNDEALAAAESFKEKYDAS